jgi:hypothetical protein
MNLIDTSQIILKTEERDWKIIVDSNLHAQSSKNFQRN